MLPEKSVRDVQMGDGTDHHSSDVSDVVGDDDGTNSSIASAYSVEPFNPTSTNENDYLSTPLMNNRNEEGGRGGDMNSIGYVDRFHQLMPLPNLGTRIDKEIHNVSHADTKNEIIIPPQIKIKVARSANLLDVNSLISPRSISVEELKLVQMESGLNSPKTSECRSEWRTSTGLEAVNETDSTLKVYETQGENTIIQDAHQDTGDLSTGETEGANGILHKRKDLTACSDAASSLKSSIAYKELKMKKLIGGGGFGEVHEATWRGTPVAVKVLAASSQAENVKKAILQEFAAEINMVSGMRHPNICLYIGACLEHPHRCIVTGMYSFDDLFLCSKYFN